MIMSQLTRREFFSSVALKTADTAKKALAAVMQQNQVRSPLLRPQGTAVCPRCYVPFNPVADESLCPTCLDAEKKQQALLEDALKNM